MKETPFHEVLQQLMLSSGLDRKKICEQVEDQYGPRITITVDELRRYAKGENMPRLPKFAALVDVLGASHGEIARLIRSTPRNPVSGSK